MRASERPIAENIFDAPCGATQGERFFSVSSSRVGAKRRMEGRAPTVRSCHFARSGEICQRRFRGIEAGYLRRPARHVGNWNIRWR